MTKSVYVVQNNNTGRFYKTRGGKFVWAQPGHAKNGFLSAEPYAPRSRFQDQEEWSVAEAVVITKAEYDELKARA